jgi:predicted nucleic acid-binding protein|tara:strand:+ start:25 stop:462 length:438 start_codon:yes stop_codon:yes gene_type:complete
MKVVLDTSSLIKIERQDETSILIVELLSELDAQMFVSAISISELYIGAYFKDVRSDIVELKEFLSAFSWVEMNHSIAEDTGKIIAKRIRLGKPVDYQDNVISATFLDKNADYLLTMNDKHFKGLGFDDKIVNPKELLKILKKEKN